MGRRLHLAPGMVLLLGLVSMRASGQDVDIDALKFTASQAVRYDSNLFRRSIDQRSETKTTTTAGIEFDQRYSLQRVELDATVAANRYRSNDYLNFNALNYRAVWHWSLTPRLHGTLRRTRSENINTFDYFRSFDRNLRTDHETAGDAEVELGRDWRLLGGLERAKGAPTSALRRKMATTPCATCQLAFVACFPQAAT